MADDLSDLDLSGESEAERAAGEVGASGRAGEADDLTDAPQFEEPAGDDGPADDRSWSQIWQMPVLLAGVGLFLLGIYLAMPGDEVYPFDVYLEKVSIQLKLGEQNPAELTEAHAQLQDIAGHLAEATPQQEAQYWALQGDLIYMQQAAAGGDVPSNHRAIIAAYTKARDDLGLKLEGVRFHRLVHAYVALDRFDDAMKLLPDMKAAGATAAQRGLVLRRIIDRHLHGSPQQRERVLALLERYVQETRDERDPAARLEQEIWAVATEARLLIEVGDVQRALALLYRRTVMFEAETVNAATPAALAPLYVLMGQAYEKQGDIGAAEENYRIADRRIDPTDPLKGQVLVGLGRVALAAGEENAPETAHGFFVQAMREFEATPAYLDAVLGAAHSEALMDKPHDAIEHFDLAVEHIVKLRRDRDRYERKLTDMISAHYDRRRDKGDYQGALDYLNVLASLHGGSEMPAPLLAQFAYTHEQLAVGLREDAEEMDRKRTADAEAAVELRDTVRFTRRSAAEHFGRAAEYYYRHAMASRVADDTVFGASLWKAANSYDEAQMWDKAIDTYAEYALARPGDLLAINHLGLAYMSNGSYAAAADRFRKLIDDHPKSPEAFKSLVPLAQCHMAMEAVDDAERVLLHVVTNHPAITPDSQAFQEALITLGRLYYDQQKYEPAIERLKEALDRYGQTPDGMALRFMLADAYRRSIAQIDRTLDDPLPQSRRDALQAERADRLDQAEILYSQVINEVEANRYPDMTDLQKLWYRNSYFYRADCAFELGRLDRAIQLYELAAKRWDAHPASLVALIQIVKAYSIQGKVQEARATNGRARFQLERIPDEAFDDPTLPMTRQHWQDWLRLSEELDLFGSQANAVRGNE